MSQTRPLGVSLTQDLGTSLLPAGIGPGTYPRLPDSPTPLVIGREIDDIISADLQALMVRGCQSGGGAGAGRGLLRQH